MKGQLSSELEVAVPATNIWEVYGSLEMARLLPKLMPSFLPSVEVVEGDGGVGTVLKAIFPPGIPDVTYLKEKFTKIDNEKRIKEVEVIEGGYLNLGFTLFRITFEIIEKDSKSSIIKSTIDYEVDDDSADNAAFVSTKPFETMAEGIAKYLMEKKDM